MLRFAIIAAVFVGLTTTGFSRHPKPSHFRGYPPVSDVRVSIGVFYTSLSPYGEWIDCNLGYVWRPYRVARGWRPYLHGHWIWTDHGWYWVSDEPFGWATYHYGRWYYDDYYGWIWIPDETWGPAWVEWRYNDDYIGWAPLPPHATFRIGVGIAFTSRWVSPYHYWSFIPCRYFVARRVVDYVRPVEWNRRSFGSTRSVVNIEYRGNRVMNPGVDARFVERQANTRLTRFEVVPRERDSGGERVINDGRRVEVYRPRTEGRGRVDESRPPNVRRSERSIELHRGMTEERERIGRSRDRRIDESESRQLERDRGRRDGTSFERPQSRRGSDKSDRSSRMRERPREDREESQRWQRERESVKKESDRGEQRIDRDEGKTKPQDREIRSRNDDERRSSRRPPQGRDRDDDRRRGQRPQ